jgi:cellulose synthase/poly-beta-1,6-N-acetylglucosamine synthase-like glycosyltransferase
MNWWQFLISLLFLVALLPVAVFCLEVLAGCWPRRRTLQPVASIRPRLAVLIPAHNEAKGIEGTLQSVRSQLQVADRIVVVADHCTDATAELTRRNGAEVVERQNSPQRGKGYALACGLDYLQADPPEVVVFIDADCRLGDHALTRLAVEAQATQCPVQGLNLCVPPERSGNKHLLSGLAFRFKNLVRMQGITRLGGACHLTGTGMAIPWELVRTVAWASGNVVEDMQLGIDYTVACYPPRFVPDAEVRSELPTSEQGLLQQRRRWEHGFLTTATSQTPRLLKQAWQQGNWALFLLALDLCVPPLALLTILLTGYWIAAVVCWFVGWGTLPLTMLTIANVLSTGSFILGWFCHCREAVPLRTLMAIPAYIMVKIPLYLGFLIRPETQWVRAQRS